MIRHSTATDEGSSQPRVSMYKFQGRPPAPESCRVTAHKFPDWVLPPGSTQSSLSRTAERESETAEIPRRELPPNFQRTEILLRKFSLVSTCC